MPREGAESLRESKRAFPTTLPILAPVTRSPCARGAQGVADLHRVNVHSKLQAGFPHLVLKSEAHKLCLVLAKRCSESCRPLQTNRAPPVFDIAEMRTRN